MQNDIFVTQDEYTPTSWDYIITMTTYVSLVMIHLLLIIALVLVPLFYVVFHRKKLYLFDITIKIGFLSVIVYILVSFFGAQSYTLGDYMNMLYEYSKVENTDPTQLLFFLIVLNIDNISPILIILLNSEEWCRCQKFNQSDVLDDPHYDVRVESMLPYDELQYEKMNAFIIVCHNSSDKIKDTIDTILVKVPPECIYVSDNGSTAAEVEKVKKICEHTRTNYLGLLIGNKTKSQFATANVIKINNPEIQYVTLIDDDTHLPNSWSFKHVKSEHFDRDPSIVCVPFPLTVKNKVNFATSCENLEYLLAGHSKIAQSKLGTTMFGSGGFSVWNLDVFLEVVLHHNSVFNGEDFQLGMICHKSYGKKWITQIKTWDFCPKLDTCNHIFVPTIAPIHWFHMSDIPVFGQLFSKCECGESSLYWQRARGWDLTRQRFMFDYLTVLFSKAPVSWRSFWVKLLYFNEVLMVLNDWSGVVFIFIFGILRGQWNEILRGFIISICITIPIILIVNYAIFSRFKVSMIVVLLYTVLYKIPMNTLIKIDCMFYNFVVYSGSKNPKAIIDQLNSISVFITFSDYWRKYVQPEKQICNVDLGDDLTSGSWSGSVDGTGRGLRSAALTPGHSIIDMTEYMFDDRHMAEEFEALPVPVQNTYDNHSRDMRDMQIMPIDMIELGSLEKIDSCSASMYENDRIDKEGNNASSIDDNVSSIGSISSPSVVRRNCRPYTTNLPNTSKENILIDIVSEESEKKR